MKKFITICICMLFALTIGAQSRKSSVKKQTVASTKTTAEFKNVSEALQWINGKTFVNKQGETLSWKDGKFYQNGELQEPYDNEDLKWSMYKGKAHMYTGMLRGDFIINRAKNTITFSGGATAAFESNTFYMKK